MRFFNVARVRFVRSLLLAGGALCLSTAAFAQIGISVDFAPPELPVYEQPICPGDGYIWTPGYWAWGDGAYYWVSGDWVMPPEVGFLWTPGYWGWRGGGFFFNEGYWGTSVGFYGGINYGFGYFGNGYEGGRWDGGRFFYNTAYNRVNAGAIHNVYNARVRGAEGGRVSYNGGRGGIEAHATAQQEAAANGRHAPPVAAQTEHAQAARSDPRQRSSANHGAAPGGHAEENRSGTAVHPKDLAPIARSAAPNTGNAKMDQKYQKEQDRLNKQQNQERQKLQQRQDKEHQQQGRQQANAAKSQQMEQRHQQQTQQMQQRHTQQSQQMQQRQSAGGGGSRGGESHGGGGERH